MDLRKIFFVFRYFIMATLKEREDVVLLFEFSRLQKKGAISSETFLRTMEEWKV